MQDVEEQTVEQDGAELCDQDPEIVQPETFVLVGAVHPAPGAGADVDVGRVQGDADDGAGVDEDVAACDEGEEDRVGGLVAEDDVDEGVDCDGDGEDAGREVADGDEEALGPAHGGID